MSKKMLVDATHSEETRVAVVSENLLEDYDFESILRKSLKGNIYLAKVTRVEPSLQAAFVNFGGNRHGFLPFSEIHPDYYKIPVADREALMEEQEELARKMQEEEDAELSDDAQEETISEDTSKDEKKSKSRKKPARRRPSKKDDEKSKDEDKSEEDVKDEKKEKTSKVSKDKKETEKKKKTTRKKTQAAKSENDEIVADEVAETSKDDGNKKKKSSTKKTSTRKKSTSRKPKSDEKETLENKKPTKTKKDVDGNKKEDEPSEADGNKKNSDDGDGNKKGNHKGRRNYRNRRGRRGGRNRRGGNSRGRHQVKEVGGGDDYDEDEQTALWKKMRRSYKIQEVIKRGQIMLVQVQKEERGNKGAAVTSYITLPGRYSVLMPNSPRGGGVSRKIPFKERKNLKNILNELTVPKAMSIIIRTAGIGRTKTEIKRDLDYLYRLWDTIRDLTLKSTAPALVYEEGNLVKRAIRDIYTRDIEEVHVAGEDGYKTAKDFMKMMIPSHAKRIQKYKEDDELPLFHRYQVEGQIDEIHNAQVQLPSGGYLVINPTEALVAIDVNSGRATKERHIEETALKTNLESAVEVARQLRLRDLGGLVVIDFIDMEDYRNNREVERKLAEALSKDRARVQMGRISNFGLMELSRQRLRPSLTETHFMVCPHCNGAGHVPNTDAAAIRILRAIEEEGIKHRSKEITVTAPTAVVNYLLNNKRQKLAEIEKRYQFLVHIEMNHEMGPAEFELERTKGTAAKEPKKKEPRKDSDKIDENILPESEDKSSKRKSSAKPKPKKDEEPAEVQEEDIVEEPIEEVVTEEVPKEEMPEEEPAANDDVQAKQKEPELKAKVDEHVVVNQAPKKKKKGWWQKLVD